MSEEVTTQEKIKNFINRDDYISKIQSKYIYNNSYNSVKIKKNIKFLQLNLSVAYNVYKEIMEQLDLQRKLKIAIGRRTNIGQNKKSQMLQITEDKINTIQERKRKYENIKNVIQDLIKSYPQSSIYPENINRPLNRPLNISYQSVLKNNSLTLRPSESTVPQPHGCIGSSCVISGGKKKRVTKYKK